ncbi:DUF6531 domain-containing protein [Streptomyces sp. NBC_00210]|uniref:putative T7SS-secreted protein n=1 Tax=Streptomyces sp. NBC_00210 TaxID=2903636 RepID=UPI003253FFD6
MGIGDFIKDITPDSVEDAVEGATEWVGDRVEDAGDWTADRLEDVGWESGADWVREQSRSLANRMGAEVDEMDLGQTEDKTKLIYGSADKLRETAQNLRDFQGAFTSVGKGLKGLDSAHLKGQGADAFRETVAIEPPKWFTAADACRKASGALEIFADTVGWAQGQAQLAIDKWKKGQEAEAKYRAGVDAYNKAVDHYNGQPAESRDPSSLPPKPGTTNPGIALLREAQDILDEARRQRNEEAATARKAVQEARDAAPAKPSYGHQAMDGLDEIQIMQDHFGAGAIKGTAGLVSFVRSINPTDPYNITHPAEYLLSLNSTAAGLVTVANDPWGAGKQMVTDFMKDPAEGLGRLVPDLVLTVATDGAGAGVKAVRVADDLADANKVRRRADDVPGGTHLRPDGNRITTATDPVDLASGRMFLPQTDVTLPGALPLAFTRRVESGYSCGRFFGPSWSSTVDERLAIDAAGIIHVTEDGLLLPYPHPVPGVPTRPDAAAGGLLERTEGGDYTLTDPDTGVVRHFTAPDGAEPGGDGVGWLAQMSDRNGHTITIDRAAEGAPLALVHSAGYRLNLTVADGRVTTLALAGAGEDGTDRRLIRYAYTDGNLTTVTKASGGTLTFDYDDRQRVTAWIDSNQRRYDYVYDDQDRVICEGGEAGHVQVTISYGDPAPDTGHRTTVLTTPAGHTTRYLIDERCHVRATTDALGHTTDFTHDARGRLLTRTDPLGHTTCFAYDEDGRPTKLTRPDGSELSTRYNALGMPEEFTTPGGGRWRQEFDERGNRTAVTDPAGHTTRYAYDSRGHLSEVIDPLGAVTTVRCNPAGLPLEFADPLGGMTRYERDSFGRPTAITGPDDATTRLRWTDEGELACRTAPDGSVETWTYDGEGNCTSHTDPAGRTTCFEYTHFDLLAARTTPDGQRYEFAHDAELRLTGVTNPQGMKWSYAYDPVGRLISETDFDQRTISYELDPAGRLITRSNPLGEAIRYENDALGQVIRKDAAGRITTYAYDQDGRLVQAAGPESELVHQYDQRGLVRTELVDGRVTSYAHDALGRRTRRITPSGAKTTYTYDAAGRCTSLTAGARRVEFSYDPAGRELARHVGRALSMTSAWDAVGRLTDQHFTAGTRTLNRRSYTYRADGNLTAVEDDLRGSHRFALDGRGRVTSVTAQGWTESYAYDAAGNQTAAAWPEGHPGTDAQGDRAYAGTRITRAGANRYEHDAAGRLVQRTRTRLSRKPDIWRYSYDAEGRLTDVTTPDGIRWRYRYDALGRRTSKQRLAADGRTVLEQTDFTWDGDVLAEQTTTNPAQLPHPVTLTWDHQGLQPIAQTERLTDEATQREIDTRFFAIATDLIGTPTELVDEQGGIAWRTRPTLWGTTTWNADATAYTPLRFPGQYYDPETGLHYNHHRYYDPQTARYTTPDPLGLAPAPNPATYVHNPHTWSDPLGLSPCARGAWEQRADFTNQKVMSKKYDAHAADFGVTGNRNGQTMAQFQQTMRDHMVAPDTKIYRFDYRGQGTAVGFIDPNTQKMVMLHTDGSFWTAYRLGDNQFRDIVDNGHLW